MADNILDDQMISELLGRLKTGKNHENFLQYYSMFAESELAKKDHDAILNEIAELAAQATGYLAKKINAVADEMDIDLAWSDEELEIIINKIGQLKTITTTESLETGILSLVAQILTKEYEKAYRGDQLLDKNIAMMRFLLNCELNQKVSQLQNNQEFFNISPEVLYTIRDVVIDESVSHMLETLRHEQLHEIIFSMRAKIYQNKRWAGLNLLYQEALEYAAYQWATKKSKKTRNEMAEYLQTDEKIINEYNFDKLDFERLRKMLGPIAVKYGKLPKRGRPRKKSP
jgi:hypothetical protein